MTRDHKLQLLIDQRDVIETELNRINEAIRRFLEADEPSEVTIRRQRDEEWR